MTELQNKILGIVETISKKLAELYDVSGESLPNKLGPPAKPEQIAALERRRGFELPEDYKAFLTLHDGWTGFNGDSALLSIADMQSGPIYEGHCELQGELIGAQQLGPGEGFIFEGSLGTRISYFDLFGKRTTGKLDAVLWNRREAARYSSFTDFLEGYVAQLDRMIAKERENLR